MILVPFYWQTFVGVDGEMCIAYVQDRSLTFSGHEKALWITREGVMVTSQT